MTRVNFAALLVALVIGSTSLGSVASYYLNVYVGTPPHEPIRLPLPLPGQSRCMYSQNPNQPDPDVACVALQLAIHQPCPYSLPTAEKLHS